jgi:hypothetical protein
MNQKLLRIYMQDHYAAATAGAELARRTSGSNEGTAFGAPLARIAAEIDEDRDALEAMMRALGFGGDRVKNAALWAGEKIGRLKPNGRLTGYSPLSRMVELEGLTAGVAGKRALWCTLSNVAASEPRLDRARLSALIERADAQLAVLDDLRSQAADEAFVA